MTDITQNDLMMAVLSMDAYAYHQEGVWQIGNATVLKNADQSTGFAAVAYNYGGQTIISYRGTDGLKIGDAIYGWGGGFGYETTQARLAANFYHDVTAADSNAGTNFPYSTSGSIVFTGHSLGGGLAGLMAGLYGQQAVVFDNMAYQDAINTTFQNANASDATSEYIMNVDTHDLQPNPHYVSLQTFFGGVSPKTPDTGPIAGYHELRSNVSSIGNGCPNAFTNAF